MPRLVGISLLFSHDFNSMLGFVFHVLKDLSLWQDIEMWNKQIKNLRKLVTWTINAFEKLWSAMYTYSSWNAILLFY